MTPSAETDRSPLHAANGQKKWQADSKSREGPDRPFVAKWALAFQWARAIMVQPQLLGLQILSCGSDNFS